MLIQVHRIWIKSFSLAIDTIERSERMLSRRLQTSNPEGLNSRREIVHWACIILMENAKLCGEKAPATAFVIVLSH